MSVLAKFLEPPDPNPGNEVIFAVDLYHKTMHYKHVNVYISVETCDSCVKHSPVDTLKICHWHILDIVSTNSARFIFCSYFYWGCEAKTAGRGLVLDAVCMRLLDRHPCLHADTALACKFTNR